MGELVLALRSPTLTFIEKINIFNEKDFINYHNPRGRSSGPKRTRTACLRFAKAALYQMSYGPLCDDKYVSLKDCYCKYLTSQV